MVVARNKKKLSNIEIFFLFTGAVLLVVGFGLLVTGVTQLIDIENPYMKILIGLVIFIGVSFLSGIPLRRILTKTTSIYT